MPRPMELKSLKACFPKLRRRYGSTSPPLAGVHPNPGPKQKCRRWEAKKDSKRIKLTDDEKDRINKLSAEGKSGDDIAHEIGRKEETVRRWMKRRKYTGEMKRKERSRKRRVDAIEDKETSTSRESPRKKPKKWKRFDDREQGYATALLDTGLSHKKIAKMMKRGRRTLDRRAKQNEGDQRTDATTASRLGRPRKTTPRDDRALARRADAPDEPSARSIAAESKIHNPDHAISKNTVCRRLKEQGEVPRRKIPKLRLTKEQKAARLRWAEAHKDWTLDQWNRVLWSDESPFTIVPTPSRKFVWIRKGKRAKNMKASVDPKQVAPTAKWGGGKIQVWGCFYAGGVGHLTEIQGTLKKEGYKSILIHHVIPLITQKTSSEPSTIAWIFQQDGAKPHTANTNVDYLQRKAQESGESWTVMEWPPQSPDLNPLENVWHYLKDQLRKHPHLPTSKKELFERLQTEWEKLGPDALQPYVSSMPQRCSAVIEAKGGPIAF